MPSLASLHRMGKVSQMDTDEDAGTHPDDRASAGRADRTPLRVPITAAAERGVSWLASTASERRVVLTRFGRPTAVVDSAQRLDETARLVRQAHREVIGLVSDTVSQRGGPGISLEQACERLGLDPARVRERARRAAD